MRSPNPRRETRVRVCHRVPLCHVCELVHLGAPPMLRRTLLKGALASIPFALMWRPRAARAHTGVGGYGPLVDDPDNIFDLPAGFSYKVISRQGDMMSDGYRTPGHPDGMACFAGAAGT